MYGESLNKVQRESIEIVHFDEFIEVYGEHFKSNDQVLAEDELVQSPDDVLLVIRVQTIQRLYQLGLHQTLLV